MISFRSLRRHSALYTFFLLLAMAAGTAAQVPKASLIWKFSTKRKIRTSPVLGYVNDDMHMDVVVASEDKTVYLIDGSTGVQIWTYTADAPFYASPVIGDVDGDGKVDVVAVSSDGKVAVLKGETGRRLWEMRPTEQQTFPVATSPVLSDVSGDNINDVIFLANDARLYALRGNSGTIIWKSPRFGLTESTPCVFDVNRDGTPDVIMAYTNRKVVLINGRNGQPLWTRETGAEVASSPSVADVNSDGVYDVIFGSGDKNVWIISGVDGSRLWTYPSSDKIDSSPTIVELTGDAIPDVVIGSSGGYVYALNPLNHTEIWKRHIGGWVKASPALGDFDADDRPDIVVGSNNQVFVLRGRDGTVLLSHKISGTILTSPVVGDVNMDEKLDIVVTSGKCVYALGTDARIPSGWISWQMFKGTNSRTGNSELVRQQLKMMLDKIARIQKYLRNAKEFLTRGLYDDAMNELDRLLSIDPNNQEGQKLREEVALRKKDNENQNREYSHHMQQARELLLENNLDEARSEVNRALEFKPDDESAKALLTDIKRRISENGSGEQLLEEKWRSARADYEMGKYDEAVAKLTALVNEAPGKFPEAPILLENAKLKRQAQLEKNREEQLKAQKQTAVARDKRDILRKISADLSKKNTDMAAGKIKKASRKYPLDADFNNELAALQRKMITIRRDMDRQEQAAQLVNEARDLMNRQKWADALRLLNKAREIDPQNLEVSTLMAEARASKAKEDARRRKAEAAYQEAIGLARSGKLKAAILKFNEAVEAWPGYKDAEERRNKAEIKWKRKLGKDDQIRTYLEYARNALDARKPDTAKWYFNKVLGMDSGNARARAGLRKVKALQDKIELESRANRDKKFRDLLVKGDNALDNGDYKTALDAFNSALQIRSTPALASRLARTRKLIRENEQLKATTAQVDGYIRKANAAFADKDWEKAVRFYHQALDLDPTRTSIVARLKQAETQMHNAGKLERLRKTADEALAERNWEKAIKALNSILELEPENADALSDLASAQRWRKTIWPLQRMFVRRGVSTRNAFVYALLLPVIVLLLAVFLIIVIIVVVRKRKNYLRRGDVLFNMSEWAEAARSYQQHLEHRKNDFAAMAKLVKCYEELGQFANAVRQQKALIELKDDSPGVHDDLARLLARNKEYQQAIDVLNGLIKRADSSDRRSEILERLIELYIKTGKWMNVSSCYKKLVDANRITTVRLIDIYRDYVKSDPKNTIIHRELASMYWNRGDRDSAVMEYQILVDLEPNNEEFHLNLGDLYLEKGLQDEARRHYLMSYKSNPYIASEIIEKYNKILNQEPDHIRAWIELSNIYLDQGNLEEAEKCARHVYRIDKTSELFKRQIEAIYRKRMQLNPDDPELRYRMGKQYLGEGRVDEAIAVFQELILEKSMRSRALKMLGLAFFKKGQFAQVIENLEDALAMETNVGPENVDAYYILGLSYEKQKMISDAGKIYKRIYGFKRDYKNIALKLMNLKRMH